MANDLQSLSILYQNRLFRIPDYQRGYAWRHEQLVDFWEDLLNLHEDRYHYTGLLSLKEVNRNDLRLWHDDRWLLDIGYKPFHVVDGQQRLTTFSILMYEITAFIKRHPENAEKTDDEIYLGYESLKDVKAKYIFRKCPPHNIIITYLFGYETDNPSSDYLKHRVFEEPFGGTVFETYYTKNLKYAKLFFAENLKVLYEKEGIDGIERLYKKLTLRLMFNLHEIEDDYDVFVAFETMNNRGKKLTNLELLKNRLIYLSTLFDNNQLDEKDKEQLRENINNAWKEIYYQLGRNQNAPLSDDDFLRAHWITYFQYTRKRGDDYIRFLLRKFSAKNVFEKFTIITQSDESDPLPGFDLSEDDDTSDDVSEPELLQVSKLSPIDISNYVNSLKKLAEFWYYSFFPKDSLNLTADEKAWIDKLNRVGIGYFRPLVAAALSTANKTTATERINLFQAIERFIFLAFRVAGFNASFKSSDYNNKARELLLNNISMDSIIEDLNSTVERTLISIVVSFIARTNRRFETGEGFYSWRDLRYFLYEYEYELATRNKLEKVDWNLFTNVEKDKITIEHILPQTPVKSYWRNQFRQYTENEIKILSASLGNLLPLSQSINSSMQNDGFPDKKNPPNSRRRGYMFGSHSEIQVSSEQDWNADNILKRGLMLLHFMESRWKLTLTNEQKMQLLHLEFMNDDRELLPELPQEDVKLPLIDQLEKTVPSSGESARYNKRYRFWKNTLPVLRDKTGFFNNVSPTIENWVSGASGYGGIAFNSIVLMHGVRAEIYINTSNRQRNTNIYEMIKMKEDEIITNFPGDLIWQELPGKKACRICVQRNDFGWNDEEHWDEIIEWLADNMAALMRVLKPVLDDIMKNI